MSRQLSIVSAATLAGLAGSAFAQVGGTPVAVSGVTGTYGPNIGTFTFSATAFSAPGTTGRTATLNAAGDVALIGTYAGGNGVWRRTVGATSNTNLMVATNTLPAPATSGTFNSALQWGGLVIDNAANVMFYNAIAGTTGPLGTTTDGGSFRYSGPGAGNFANRGANTGVGFGAPGALPGRSLPIDFTPTPATEILAGLVGANTVYNRSGTGILMGAWNNGTTSGQGMWFSQSNPGGFDTLTPIILPNMVLPGLGNVTAPQASFAGGVAINDPGRWAATIDYTTASIPTTAQNRGIYTNRNGTIEVLAVRSTPAPWLPTGVNVGTIGAIAPSFNNAGQVATNMNVSGTGITQANDSMVVRWNANGSVTTIQEGTLSGRTFGGFGIRLGGQLNTASNFSNTVVANDGTLFSTISGNTDTNGTVLTNAQGAAGIFLVNGATNAISVIALTGDTAPGTTGTFTSFSTGGRAINSNNQVAFVSLLTQGVGGVTSANDTVLYATDLSGNLVLIAREGFALPGDPVSGRTVSSIFFNQSVSGGPTNGQDGRGVFFNDNSTLVYQIGFSDGGSGVFVTSIPTPGSAALLGLGLVASGRRRRI